MTAVELDSGCDHFERAMLRRIKQSIKNCAAMVDGEKEKRSCQPILAELLGNVAAAAACVPA